MDGRGMIIVSWRGKTWREIAREQVAEVRAALPADATAEDFKKQLMEANPWRSGPNWQYRMYCEEQRRALAEFEGKPFVKHPRGGGKKPKDNNPDQMELPCSE